MSAVISWDEYFMGIAQLSAFRSKDRRTKVGACIVNANKRIIGIGYNGFPNGCDDTQFPWETEGDFLDQKYAYVVHAELNAILNASGRVEGCTLYASLFPCNECCKAIIQAGIVRVVFLSNKYKDANTTVAGRRMLDAAGVMYEEYSGKREAILLSFEAE